MVKTDVNVVTLRIFVQNPMAFFSIKFTLENKKKKKLPKVFDKNKGQYSAFYVLEIVTQKLTGKKTALG
jgi:hypothetical protein